MSDTYSNESDKPELGQSQRMVVLFKHLFRSYVEAKELDTEQMRAAEIRNFVPWLLNYCDWHSEGTMNYEELRAMGLEDSDIQTGWTMLQDPYNACAILLPMWKWLTLSGQRPIKKVPEFMDVALTFGFDVHNPALARAVQLRAPNTFDVNKPLTNGFLCSFLEDIFRGFSNTLAAAGLDAMYLEHSQPIGDTTKPLKPWIVAK